MPFLGILHSQLSPLQPENASPVATASTSMRIRKRWPPPPPPLPHPASLSSSSSSSSSSLLSPAPPTPDPTFSGFQQLPVVLLPLTHPSNKDEPQRLMHPSASKHLHPPCNSRNPWLLGLDPEEENDRAGSDLQLASAKRGYGWICDGGGDDYGEGEAVKKGHDCMNRASSSSQEIRDPQDGLAGEGEADTEDKRLAANNRGKESFSGAKACVGISVSSSSSSHHQGEILSPFPLKKRRRSFDGKVREDEIVVMEEEKKIINSVKARSVSRVGKNKKWVLHKQEDLEEQGNGSEIRSTTSVVKKIKKKKKRGGSSDGGGAIMEGSRCSRVNGRGWRCCQQTLVGYSLCEHHLGKGRLRSMSSVRSRATTTKPKKEEEEEEEEGKGGGSLLSYFSTKNNRMKGGEQEEEEEEEKPLLNTMKKKKKRIGIVKARSISSLLGQTIRQHATLMVTDNHLPTPTPAAAQPTCGNSNNDNHNVTV